MSSLEQKIEVPEIREELTGEQSVGDNGVTERSLTPVHLQVERLRVEDDGNSSAYTSEEEAGSHEGSHDENRTADEPEFVAPDDELRDRIIKQVEFYFSDPNILKDAFLLKHVRRNKQGFVSIKLITSFKKVKSLTKDYRVVAYSLRHSEKLEVNEEGRKVRRKDPLPEWDETTPSRSVVVVNLPMENPSIENVAEMFSKCGEVSLIRILRPGKSVPQDVKKHSIKHPEIGTTTCAVVEFEKHEAAQKACETMNNTEDWRQGMRVVLLAAQKKKENKKKDNGDDSGKEDDGEGKDKKKKRRERRKKNRVDELADNDSSCYYSSGSEAEFGVPHKGNYRTHQMLKKTLSPNHMEHPVLKKTLSPNHMEHPVLRRTMSPNNKEHPSLKKSLSGSQMEHQKLKRTMSPNQEHTMLKRTLSPNQYDSNRLSPNSSPRSSPKSSPKTSPRSRRRNFHGISPLADDKKSPSTSPKLSPQCSPDLGRKKYEHSADGKPSSPWVQRRMMLAGQDKGQVSANQVNGKSPEKHKMYGMEGVIRQPRGPDGTTGFHLGRGKPRSSTFS